MTLPERCVTSAAPSSLTANDPRPVRRASVSGALALALGCALCAPAALAQSAPALSGKWQLSCAGRGGETRQISLDIDQQGSTLSGSYSGGRRSGQLQGSVQGTQVSLELAGKRKSVSFTGTTDGNTLQLHTAKGGASCTGTRR